MKTQINDHEKSREIVYMIDPDQLLRQRVAELLKSDKGTVMTFAKAEDVLATPLFNTSGCLIVEADQVGMSVIELMHELKNQQVNLPFIVLGNENDIPQAVTMMRAGAIEFIDKPFTDQKLLRAFKNRMSEFEKRH